MLKSITCEKLTGKTIKFRSGLNTVVGADDAHNSIGKSSILMLIDFALGGGDFPEKCDDVIKHVGDLTILAEFEFDKTYFFARSTNNPGTVASIETGETLPIEDFTEFLRINYISHSCEISFREYVSGFLRIYQRNNYNHKRPLDIHPKENWESIRKRLLKIFGTYWTISKLEQEKALKQKTLNDINGTFNSGAVKKITKTQASKNDSALLDINSEIEKSKEALRRHITDITLLINERSLSLKKNKDNLVKIKIDLETKLERVNTNLTESKFRSSKNLSAILELFPEINKNKLIEVEEFHKGISSILKNQLNDERKNLIENITQVNTEISEIDNSILALVNSEEDSAQLLERLLELDRSKNEITQQNNYWNSSLRTKTEIKTIKEKIETSTTASLNDISVELNNGTKKYIEEIYGSGAIAPSITFSKTNYEFNHGDDRGTGKGYANMISLDLTFLEKTALPCLIHDSLLFKNMDTPAIERLIKIYSGFKKQIFISIDEVSKYQSNTAKIIIDSMVIKLDKDNLAFNKKWKRQSSEAK